MTLRKTSTFPELELKDFKLENAENIAYLTVRPPASFVGEYYQQTVFLKLKQHGKDKVVEAIRHLEKLDFVKGAYPNHVERPD